jgi:hypothetical protein
MSQSALFGGVADRFQFEAMRIEPVRRETMFSVLRELTGFVEDDGLAGSRPLVCGADDGSARDQECEVMKPCVQT